MKEENDDIMDKLVALYEEIESYHKVIMEFHDTNFIPAIHKPTEKGFYITLRCGYGGIYQMVNEWNGNDWETNATDGSYTIAYSKNKIILKNLLKDGDESTHNSL